MRKQFLKTALMAVAGISLLAGSALAASITGGIGMNGTWKPVDGTGTITTIPLATGIDFQGYAQGKADNTFRVNSSTETFGSFVFVDDIGTIKDFQFHPTYVGTDPLWTIGGFSFAMTTLEHESLGTQLLLYGTGMMTGNGFDPTPGVWNFSGQEVDQQNFTWSASTGSQAPIPEPATMLLFGTGLMGLAAVGRRKRVS